MAACDLDHRAADGGRQDLDGVIGQVTRMAAAMRAGRPPLDPAPTRLPGGRYSSRDRFAAERDVLFRHYPLAVAPASQLSEAGDCLALDIQDLPVLLARGRDGILRAFLNVCRHRGIKVLNEDGPCRRSTLVCPYHNWTYGLDGRLRGMPDAEKAFPDLDYDAHGLQELPVAERHGLVWLLPQPGGHLDLDGHLGAFGADLDRLDLGAAKVFHERSRTYRANWKLMLDSFMEAYHVPRLHKDTVARYFRPDGDLHVDRIGRHLRVALPRAAFDPGRPPPDFAALRQQVTIDWVVFPNTVLVLSPDFVSMIGFWPLAPGRTLVVDRMLRAADPDDPAERDRAAKSFALIHETLLDKEDWWVAESTQAGLHSGANSHLLAGRNEGGIRLAEQIFDEELAVHGALDEALRLA